MDILESTAYCQLFETVKKEGLEPIMNLVQDIQDISTREDLIRQTLFESECDLASFAKKHKDIIAYLKEHRELEQLNLENGNQRKHILNTLRSIQYKFSLVNLYLENARRLEALKVSRVTFVSSFANRDDFLCEIYRNETGEIIHITKQYTDGTIKPEERMEEEIFNYSAIPFSVTDASFVLDVTNTEIYGSIRNIAIRNFGFVGSKLPREEELQKYEIPYQLIKK